VVIISQRYIQVQRLIHWRDINTGFTVRPSTIGNQIELEITPRNIKPNGQDFIDFEELTTTLRVSPGTWVDLGGAIQNNDDISPKILGFKNTTSQQNFSLMIKVD
jgi:hypothetical protein